ncbi:MAG: DUF4386 domain-containing protein, partial [Rhodanobacteraceae bacterium]
MSVSINRPARLDRPVEPSPRSLARAVGAFWLLALVAGVPAIVITMRLVVSGDAAATAANVMTHPLLLETGFALYLVEMVGQVAVTALYYLLLRPAGRCVSLLAAFIGLAGAVIKTFSRLFFIAPLLVLGGDPYLHVFNTQQLQALALLSFKINSHGVALAVVFLGFYYLLQGYLAVRSTFLPKFLGVLTMLAGASFVCFLYPPLGYHVFLPYGIGLGLIMAVAWI